MTNILKTQFDNIADAAKDNVLIEAVTARVLTAYSSSIERFKTADLIALNALSDTEFAIVLGQKMAQASVFINAIKEDKCNTRERTKNLFLQLLSEHGGGYSSKQLALKLEKTTAAISKRRKEHRLFYLQVAGRIYHPAFQFNLDDRVTVPFKQIIKILASKDQYAAFGFLTTQHVGHGDKEQPIYELLRGEGQPPFVYEQIEQMAHQVWQ